MFIAPCIIKRTSPLEVATPLPRGEKIFRRSRAINISSLRDGNQAYIAAKFMPKANFHASPSLT